MERKRKASNTSILSYCKKEKNDKTNQLEINQNTAVSTEHQCVDSIDKECEEERNHPSTSQHGIINPNDKGLRIDKQ
ncbi:hypothetical protein AVEN_139694-1, partial [Araneus ventricosus]